MMIAMDIVKDRIYSLSAFKIESICIAYHMHHILKYIIRKKTCEKTESQAILIGGYEVSIVRSSHYL